MKYIVLALNLVTFSAPGGQLITINPHDVVSITKPRVGLEKNVQCIINMVDGKHIPLIDTCEAIKERLGNE